MKSKTISTVIFLILTILVLAACGGEEEAAAPAEIDVVQNDIYYEDSPDNETNPPTWTVPANEIINVNVTNRGALEHNFAIVEAGAEVPATFDAEADSGIILQQTGLVAGGQSTVQALTPLAAGEYVVICTVAGHYPTMQARLIVE